MAASPPYGVQDREVSWSERFHVHICRNDHGVCAVSNHPFYCGRGKMENFIKEGKEGFAFSDVSGRPKIVNANRFQLHVLVYNLFNWLRRLVLAAKMRKLQIDTVHLKLLKIAARGGCKFFCVYGGKILPVKFRYVQLAVELWD